MPTASSRERPAVAQRALLRRIAVIAPGLLSLVGAVYIALIAIDARPIADDYFFAAIARKTDAWSTLHTYWHDLTDRFSSLLLTMVSLKALGVTATSVVPLAILALLWLLVARSVHELARLNAHAMSRTQSLALGLLVSVAIVATAPSLFDTVGWFTSNVSYLAGFTAAIGVLLCFGSITRRARSSLSSCCLATALSLLLAGFHELIGATVLLAAVLAAGLTWKPTDRRTAHDGVRFASAVTAAGGSIVGVVIDIVGPGSRAREHAQHAHVTLGRASEFVTHTAGFLYGDLRSGAVALAAAAGIVGWQLIGAPRSPRARRNLVLWAVFLIVVPWIVASFMTAWAGSLDAGTRPPFRAAFLITGSVAIGVMLLVPVVLGRLPVHQASSRASGLISALALLLVAGGSVGLSRDAAPIIRAERIRATLIDSRDTLIGAGVARRASVITVLPAPLLMGDTQAFDLSYDGIRLGAWNLPVLRSYFGVPVRTRVRVQARQPAAYCLPGVIVARTGVRSCAQISASGRTPS